MGNIGGEIANGAAHALWGIVSAIPLGVWLIGFVAVCAVIAVMRVVTNWKVDAVLIVVATVIALVVYYRQHWIDQGYNEALTRVKAAEAQVAAYKKTNGLIEACYARNSNASILWDRTNGDCVRADGSPVH